MRTVSAAGIFLVVALSAANFSIAQSPPADADSVVKARQDFMGSLFKDFLRGFVPIAKGESTDISGVAEKAMGLAAAAKTIPSYFPVRTGRDVVPATRATAEVWTDRATFDAKTQDLVRAAEKLANTARSGQLEAVKAQIQDTFGACFGCHQGPVKSGGRFRYEET